MQPCLTKPDLPKRERSLEKPDVLARNFNEQDCLGRFETDQKGGLIVTADGSGGFIDLDAKKCTKDGYLLNPDGKIVSSTNPDFVMFEVGSVPPSLLFERHNFSAFDCFGSFKGFRNDRDAATF